MSRKPWILAFFADDLAHAAASLGWIAAIRAALALGMAPVWAACLLASGLGALLLWSVFRAAR